MTWIVDIDVLGVDAADPPDLYEIAFDVTFPGETWCRSLVLVASDLSHLDEHELVNQGRDALVALVDREGRPVSATVRLSSTGVEVLAVAAPGG